nr:DNA repair protein XRCC1 isoform X1 [Leptinotarsa decemlineata]
MPPIKVDYVMSFSSEDPVHVASNVLKNDSKKWKCRTAGEKMAVIVLQLEKATEISGIDIGNEHSAFVEVLVSRSGGGDDFKGLLMASAFMTPAEAKQSQNVNQVRMFTKEHLLKPQCDEKWDRVKVVCTQPFNRYVQYGLSFIILHTKEEKPSGTLQGNIGKFALRPASPDIFTAGSLFAKVKEQKKEEKLSGAAAIREAALATSLARFGSPKCKPKLKTGDSAPTQNRTKVQQSEEGEEQPRKDRNRTGLFYSEDDDKPNEKIDRIIKKKKEEDEAKKNKDEGRKQSAELNIWGLPKVKTKDDEREEDVRRDKDGEKAKKKVKDATPAKGSKQKEVSNHDSPSTSKQNESKRDLKRKLQEDTTKEDTKKKKMNIPVTKPYERLLEGITIVVSGIQNPDRAMLRTTALSMGAKYKPDWDSSCTHLICAFANTPKFNQVKGKGKIVRQTWLEECHKQRKRLPWRRYALDKSDKDKDESEDEICEAVETVEMDVLSDSPVETDLDYNDHRDEGSDTEERIAKILAAQSATEKKTSPSAKANGDIYCVDTDEEEFPEKSKVPEVEELAGFFDGKVFYVDQSFDDETYAKLRKYIVAYRGKMADDPTEDVDVIVAAEDTSESFKEINADASCVRPDWIWKCHNESELVAFEDYMY